MKDYHYFFLKQKIYNWLKEIKSQQMHAQQHQQQQVPVVQEMDSAIHQINHYPLDKC